MTAIRTAPRPATGQLRSKEHGSTSRSRLVVAIPPLIILAVQAALSIRMLHVSGASGDEALYIYSGHQLIHEFWMVVAVHITRRISPALLSSTPSLRRR